MLAYTEGANIYAKSPGGEADSLKGKGREKTHVYFW